MQSEPWHVTTVYCEYDAKSSKQLKLETCAEKADKLRGKQVAHIELEGREPARDKHAQHTTHVRHVKLSKGLQSHYTCMAGMRLIAITLLLFVTSFATC